MYNLAYINSKCSRPKENVTFSVITSRLCSISPHDLLTSTHTILRFFFGHTGSDQLFGSLNYSCSRITATPIIPCSKDILYREIDEIEKKYLKIEKIVKYNV